MTPITQTITSPTQPRPDVTTATPEDLAPDAWSQLEAHITAEPDMQTYPAHLLEKRWRDGLASVVLHVGQIVVYVGLDATYNDDSRMRLAAALNVAPDALPCATVYKGVSGWTRSDWRRRGLGVKARKPLYDSVLGERELYLASTSGVGAVPLWERLGWQVISWDGYAHLAALEGWYADFDADGLASRFYTPGVGWETFTPHAPYNGPHVSPFAESDHDWERYAHLGMSSVALAGALNASFAAVADLETWRQAVVQAFPPK